MAAFVAYVFAEKSFMGVPSQLAWIDRGVTVTLKVCQA
jgi:hypothetical protein